MVVPRPTRSSFGSHSLVHKRIVECARVENLVARYENLIRSVIRVPNGIGDDRDEFAARAIHWLC